MCLFRLRLRKCQNKKQKQGNSMKCMIWVNITFQYNFWSNSKTWFIKCQPFSRTHTLPVSLRNSTRFAQFPCQNFLFWFRRKYFFHQSFLWGLLHQEALAISHDKNTAKDENLTFYISWHALWLQIIENYDSAGFKNEAISHFSRQKV